MQFLKSLRPRVRSGEITTSIRVWTTPRVRVGKRYPLGDGQVEIDAIQEMSFEDISPELARASGFAGVVDLLKTARHGRGRRVFLVRFHYVSAATA